MLPSSLLSTRCLLYQQTFFGGVLCILRYSLSGPGCSSSFPVAVWLYLSLSLAWLSFPSDHCFSPLCNLMPILFAEKSGIQQFHLYYLIPHICSRELLVKAHVSQVILTQMPGPWPICPFCLPFLPFRLFNWPPLCGSRDGHQRPVQLVEESSSFPVSWKTPRPDSHWAAAFHELSTEGVREGSSPKAKSNWFFPFLYCYHWKEASLPA